MYVVVVAVGSSSRAFNEAETCLARGPSPLQHNDNLKVLFVVHGGNILKVSSFSEGKRGETRARRQKKERKGDRERWVRERERGKKRERYVCSGYCNLLQRVFLLVYSVLIIFLSQKKKKREKMPALSFDFGRSAIT